MDQTIINFALAVLGTILGFLLNVVWQAVKDLQAADRELADRLSSIEVLVAGKYVTRDEMARMVDALFHKLNRIEAKLDTKADKPDHP